MYALLEAMGRAAKRGVRVFSLRTARMKWEEASEKARHHAVGAAINNGHTRIGLNTSSTPKVSWPSLSTQQQRAIAEFVDQLIEEFGEDISLEEVELVEVGIRHVQGRKLDTAERYIQTKVAGERKGKPLPTEGYKNLTDAAKYKKALGRGSTEIWYQKPATSRNFSFDVERGEQELPKTRRELKKTHALLGKIKSTRPETIYMNMQGEVWSPQGEARRLIMAKGLTHTSMMIGDIIVMGREGLMVDSVGFKKFKID